MMYKWDGKYVSESKLEEARRMVTAFESGDMELVENEQDVIAGEVMVGHQMKAVKLVMEMYGLDRKAARKWLLEKAEEICLEAFKHRVIDDMEDDVEEVESQESLCEAV